MVAHNGLGLAANQLGIPLRVFAVTGEMPTVVFNPIIVDRREEEVELEEQCLSFPGLTLKVKRSRFIKARFALANGEIITRNFSDMTARIFQHEMDHIDGKTFIGVQEGVKRHFAQKKWEKISRMNKARGIKLT
jgi:peptide deformylase